MATPKKTAGKRVTPKKPVEPKADQKRTITISRQGRLSPKKLDFIRAASGWTIGEMVDRDGSLTGKGLAGNIWLAIQSERPDITPEQIYEAEDYTELGIDLIEESAETPTNADS